MLLGLWALFAAAPSKKFSRMNDVVLRFCVFGGLQRECNRSSKNYDLRGKTVGVLQLRKHFQRPFRDVRGRQCRFLLKTFGLANYSLMYQKPTLLFTELAYHMRPFESMNISRMEISECG